MRELKCIEVRDKNDIETVVLLADTIWKEHYRSIISEAQISYMLKKFQSYAPVKHAIDEGEKYYILDFDGVPVGYCAFKREDKRLFLDKLYVIKERRGQQLGFETFCFIKDYAKKENCKLIYLTVNKMNTSSLNVYKKLGFKTESAEVTDIGNGYVMDDYQMYLYL